MNITRANERRERDRQQVTGARVVPISQIMIRIRTEDAGKTFDAVRTEVLNWMASRAGRPLPPDAWRGQAFELQDVGSQRTAAAVLDSPHYWSARADDADKQVAKRTWATEFGVAIASPAEVLFGCRLQCVSRGEFVPIAPSYPSVVGIVARRFPGEVDGRPIQEKAWVVETAEECVALVRLLRDQGRRRSVIVVSERDRDGNQLEGNSRSAADRLAAGTMALAHVIVLGANASFTLTNLLGKEFSVFNGAVRTYGSGFDPETDEPGKHPLAFLHSINSWPDGGPERFVGLLARQAFRDSVAARDLEKELPAFTTVHRLSIERRREGAIERGDSQGDLLALAMEENDSLRRQLEDDKRTHNGLLEAAEDERDDAIEKLTAARGEVRNLRDRVEHLMQALNAKGRQDEVPIPDSFDDLDVWAGKHLAGAVHLLNRAVRAARKSEFAEPEIAYRALVVLRDYYVPMRKGQVTQAEYLAELAKFGLEDSASFAGARAGQYGDEYFVTYENRRRELDRHLKGSNSRDERFGFRLYYFWDDQNSQVVVGWLPTHLTTDIT